MYSWEDGKISIEKTGNSSSGNWRFSAVEYEENWPPVGKFDSLKQPVDTLVMGRTSTTFRNGHPGLGGRPKGTQNGAGRNAWRLAGKRAGEIARRIDDIQSELLRKSTHLTTVQHVRLSALLRDRQRHYQRRSEYVRPSRSFGGVKFVFPNGVTSPTWKKTSLVPSRFDHKPRRVLLSDSGARKAFQKVQQIDRALQALDGRLRHLDFTITSSSTDATARLTVLRSMIKAEADLFSRSKDPRPIVTNRQLQIVFSHIPYDPFDPDADPPLRGLGHRRASDIWSAEEIRADRERRARFREVVEAKAHQSRHPTASMIAEEHEGKPYQRRIADAKQPENKVGPESLEVAQFFDVFGGVLADTDTPCAPCKGRGWRSINISRPNEICPDCEGTGFLYRPAK